MEFDGKILGAAIVEIRLEAGLWTARDDAG